MKEFIRIGVDLGKNYFQVHALESEDGGATTRKLSRQAMRKLFSETRPCLVRPGVPIWKLVVRHP